ncbi:MAG: type II toxin-antitoxin system VapC family toxin [Mariprofundaceae bacterium]|nr:type II toxin-antitoxin system VapC family toxin [Mariprofundaceae bacterium]
MRLVDSCGWLHVFKGTALADTYRSILQEAESETLVPTIVLYEVAKVLERDMGETVTMECVLRMQQEKLIDLSDALALEASSTSLAHGLAIADAIVYAIARQHEATLYTSDADLKGLPGVHFITLPLGK